MRNNKLPLIGTIVEATVRYESGLKKIQLRRIKSDNSQGCQWSNAEIDTYFTMDVIDWSPDVQN